MLNAGYPMLKLKKIPDKSEIFFNERLPVIPGLLLFNEFH